MSEPQPWTPEEQAKIDALVIEFRKALQPYIGRSNLNVEMLHRLKQTLGQLVAEQQDAVGPNGEPRLKFTAGMARSMGREVPDDVPDCATAFFVMGEPKQAAILKDRVVVKFEQVTSWEWGELKFVL